VTGGRLSSSELLARGVGGRTRLDMAASLLWTGNASGLLIKELEKIQKATTTELRGHS